MKDFLCGNEKDLARNSLRKKRDELSDKEREAFSEAIAARLRALSEYTAASVIMLYSSVRSEVMTAKMIENAFKDGKTVVLPGITNEKECLIEAREISSVVESLVTGLFGIKEPDPSSCRTIDVARIDLIVVPGLGFSGKGGRIGYGKGFYDRFLRSIPLRKRVAAAFECQLCEDIPTDINDVAVSKIITEKRVVETKIPKMSSNRKEQ